MNHNTPRTPLSARPLPEVRGRVLTTAQLRSLGVSPAETNEHCRPGGPWQQILPGVFLLHPGPATSEERLHAVLRYAAREPDAAAPGGPPAAVPAQPAAAQPLRPARPGAAVPVQPGTGQPHRPVYPDAVITGLAALALHGFAAAPTLLAMEKIDVLVPRLRRLRSAGCARIVRTSALPAARLLTGVPVAPVPRALADAVARLTDAGRVRRLLTEAVRDGHCEPAAVVRELDRAKLLDRPHVLDAVDSLLAEGRAVAEDRLYRMVREYGLPEPVWNVELRLPGGPHLGGLDAYWPREAVAVDLDTRAPRHDEGSPWSEYARKREHLERLGITVVHVTPRKLRDGMRQQAAIVRTALMAASDREPAAHVVVEPR
ncbi:hypothetical protein ACH4ZX_34105 [Streptomyces sp. NPDC020490]|uniref:hypothetical protein n=1 Tax=Streptomyces sp. NPDC020490 TaxID=3365078 RepID=UPI0037A77D68